MRAYVTNNEPPRILPRLRLPPLGTYRQRTHVTSNRLAPSGCGPEHREQKHNRGHPVNVQFSTVDAVIVHLQGPEYCNSRSAHLQFYPAVPETCMSPYREDVAMRRNRACCK
jgi:hypothetical protein